VSRVPPSELPWAAGGPLRPRTWMLPRPGSGPRWNPSLERMRLAVEQGSFPAGCAGTGGAPSGLDAPRASVLNVRVRRDSG
jgi:hypothetical protein